MNIWLTSDLHFNHNKAFIYTQRGFSSVEEMNEAIVKRINEKVRPDDLLYILGDVGLGIDCDAICDLIHQINGRKILIIGNHDTDSRLAKYKKEHLFEDVVFGARLKVGKIPVLLSHYPLCVENHDGLKAINIHGHTHDKVALNGRSQKAGNINVNVDAWDCYPVSLFELVEKVKNNWRKENASN